MDMIFQLTGWVGAACLLIAYSMLVMEKLKPNSLLYQGLNLIAALALIINAVYFKTYPFVLINSFWAIIAIYSIFKSRKEQ